MLRDFRDQHGVVLTRLVQFLLVFFLPCGQLHHQCLVSIMFFLCHFLLVGFRMGLGLFDNVRRTVAHTFGQSIGFFVGFVVLHQGRVGGTLLIPQCLNVYSQFTHVLQQLLVPIVFPSYLLPIDLFHDCSGGFGQKRLVGFVRVHKGGGGNVRGGGGRGRGGVDRREVL